MSSDPTLVQYYPGGFYAPASSGNPLGQPGEAIPNADKILLGGLNGELVDAIEHWVLSGLTTRLAIPLKIATSIAGELGATTTEIYLNKTPGGAVELSTQDGASFVLSVGADIATLLPQFAAFELGAGFLVEGFATGAVVAAVIVFDEQVTEHITTPILDALISGSAVDYRFFYPDGHHSGGLFISEDTSWTDADAMRSFVQHTNIDLTGGYLQGFTETGGPGSLLPHLQQFHFFDGAALADISDLLKVDFNTVLYASVGGARNVDFWETNAAGKSFLAVADDDPLGVIHKFYIPLTINGTAQTLTFDNLIGEASDGAKTTLIGFADTAAVQTKVIVPLAAGVSTLTGDLDDQNIMLGDDGGQRLIGGGLADTLVAGAGADTLQGGDGGDVLLGRGGDNSLSGGGGHDSYVIDLTTSGAGGVHRDTILDSDGDGSVAFRTAASVSTVISGAAHYDTTNHNWTLNGATLSLEGNDLDVKYDAYNSAIIKNFNDGHPFDGAALGISLEKPHAIAQDVVAWIKVSNAPIDLSFSTTDETYFKSSVQNYLGAHSTYNYFSGYKVGDVEFLRNDIGNAFISPGDFWWKLEYHYSQSPSGSSPFVYFENSNGSFITSYDMTLFSRTVLDVVSSSGFSPIPASSDPGTIQVIGHPTYFPDDPLVPYGPQGNYGALHTVSYNGFEWIQAWAKIVDQDHDGYDDNGEHDRALGTPPSANNLPIATLPLANLAGGNAGTPYAIDNGKLVQGYTDADHETLTAVNLTATHATVVNNGGGNFTILVAPGYSGVVALSYSVSDGVGGLSSASQTILFKSIATEGPDVLSGGTGTDSISGLGGNDTLVGSPGADTLDGGAGADIVDYSGSSAAVSVSLGFGGAQSGGDAAGDVLSNIEGVIGSAFGDTLTAGAGGGSLSGGGGADQLAGLAGADTLAGGDGADTLAGGGGNDALIGGAGTDVAVFGGARSDYSIQTTSGGMIVTDLRGGSPDGADSLTGVEIAKFSDGQIPLGASALSVAATDAVMLEGNSGSTAFTFTVTRVGDTSAATTASWAVTGSGLDPTDTADFQGGALPAGTVSFSPGESAKVIIVNVVGDTALEPNEGFTLTLSNPGGGTTIATASASGTITNDDAAANHPPTAVADIGAVNEKAAVTIDVLANDTDADPGDTKTLVSVSATTNGGHVSMVGGKAVYLADDDAFSLLSAGQTTTDSFTYAMRDGTGATSMATVTVTVTGVADGPTQTGGGSNDSLAGSSLDEKLDGGAGNDTLDGGAGADTLLGGAGNDSMSAGSGIDSLSAGDGNDTLMGGGGNDVLAGGRGLDLFVFGTTFGHDTVVDFKSGEDHIQFTGIGFASFADVLAHALQSGSNVVITDPAGDALQLNNVQLSSLHSADFLFA